MKFFCSILFIFTVISPFAKAQDVLTVKYAVTFPANSIELSKPMEDSLVAMFRDLNAEKIFFVEIDSYCNEENNRIFNSALATRRAKNIADYITKENLAPVNVVNYNGYPEYSLKETSTDISITYMTPTPAVTIPEVVESPPVEIKKNTTGIDKEVLLAGKNIRLKINFYPGESTLIPSSFPYVIQLKQFMQENPELRIEIQGHVCCNNNIDLSLERAEEIYIKLQEMGIAKDRLEYKGFGNTIPLVPDNTDEDHEANRRVEIRLLQ